MIRRLRRLHAGAWSVIACATPALLFAALSSRPVRPKNTDSSLSRLIDSKEHSVAGVPTAPEWVAMGLHLRIDRSAGTARLAIEVDEAFALPDALIYATPERPGDELSGIARLVSVVRGGQSSVHELEPDERWLVLYSLGFQEIVGVGSLDLVGADR